MNDYQNYWNGMVQSPAPKSGMPFLGQRPRAPGMPQMWNGYNQAPKGTVPYNAYALTGPTTGIGISVPQPLPPPQRAPGLIPGQQPAPLPPGMMRLPNGQIGYRRSTLPPMQQMLAGLNSDDGSGINGILQALLLQQLSPNQLGNRGAWGVRGY